MIAWRAKGECHKMNEYSLDPVALARTYLELDRVDDALDVMSAEFSRSPGLAAYRQLIDLASEVGRDQEIRTWALTWARQQAPKPFGAGHGWQRLAAASAQSRPIDAAELYRPGIDHDLARGANTKSYPGVAQRLATMKQLYDEGGAEEQCDEYLSPIRETHGRRPSLTRALDTAGL